MSCAAVLPLDKSLSDLKDRTRSSRITHNKDDNDTHQEDRRSRMEAALAKLLSKKKDQESKYAGMVSLLGQRADRARKSKQRQETGLNSEEDIVTTLQTQLKEYNELKSALVYLPTCNKASHMA